MRRINIMRRKIMNITHLKHMTKQNAPMLIVGGFLFTIVMISPSFGVTVEALKEPIKALKTNIFSGWMMPVQIVGMAASIVFSYMKQSLVPVGMGVGGVVSLNFFDGYLGDGAAGAVI